MLFGLFVISQWRTRVREHDQSEIKEPTSVNLRVVIFRWRETSDGAKTDAPNYEGLRVPLGKDIAYDSTGPIGSRLSGSWFFVRALLPPVTISIPGSWPDSMLTRPATAITETRGPNWQRNQWLHFVFPWTAEILKTTSFTMPIFRSCCWFKFTVRTFGFCENLV